MPTTILLLGDGNFSFSLAVARLLLGNSQQTSSDAADDNGSSAVAEYLGVTRRAVSGQAVQLIATSFDTRQQVCEKYPESVAILRHLAAFPPHQVSVRHGVNAWELAAHFGREFPRGFDAIVWNHPHLGTEDFRLHRFLMAHFFHSARSVLRQAARCDPDGDDDADSDADDESELARICISLVHGQETRWDVVRQAERVGLRLSSSSPLDEARYPGYVCKRNKTGQSFKNQSTKRHMRSQMDSTVFRFCSTMSPVTTSAGDAVDCLRIEFEEKVRVVAKDKKMMTSVPTDPAVVVTYQPSMIKNRRATKRLGKKKKMADDDTATNDEVVGQIDAYQCPDCSKQMPSLRAISQHHHMVHELGQCQPDATDAELTCPECSTGTTRKTFVKLADLRQHMISRHTRLDATELAMLAAVVPHIDTASATAPFGDDDTTYDPCVVCGQAIVSTPGSENGMLLHLETLKPVLGLQMHCPLQRDTCAHRSFTESRALEQHFRSCRYRLAEVVANK